jgi:hypothetical protein
MRYDEVIHNQHADIGDENRAARRLWAAMFHRGILDYAEAAVSPKARAKIHPDPVPWFESRANTPGAFDWLCDLFDLDPDRARMEVLGRQVQLALASKQARV